MQILGISGSLRADSTNTRLLAAAMQLVPSGVKMRVTTQLAHLPAFNPDLQPEEFDCVLRWADEVKSANGIIVSTPEYAGGYPGVLKNAFDWLVGTDAHVEKPFMMLNATSRSTIAQDTFAVVLKTMSGIHLEQASTTIPLLGTRMAVSEILGNPEFAERLQQSMLTFVTQLRRGIIPDNSR